MFSITVIIYIKFVSPNEEEIDVTRLDRPKMLRVDSGMCGVNK